MVVIGEYGVGINIFEAGSVYEVMRGVRDNYDRKRALYVNSMFLDFIKENGLNVSKSNFTKDIITINFGYGSSSFEKEKSRLEANLRKDPNNEFYQNLYERCLANEDRYDRKSADEIRKIFYTKGVEIKYGSNVIKYKFLCRSPGAAKKGCCTFIKKSLWKRAHDFLYMDLKFPKHNAKIIEASAYAALMTSSIVSKIVINPDDILVVKDYESFFKTNVIDVDVGADGHCRATHIDDYKVSNVCYDGQALIDSSIFPEWAKGFILLRNFFFKSAAFNCNLQLFFKDYFKDKYETAELKDMWGNPHRVKNIKLITTDQSMKWLKFDNITYDYWKSKVQENASIFGIVKTVHDSKLGSLEKMSYQMINSSGATKEQMQNIIAPTFQYINILKSDINAYISFLRQNANFSNDYSVMCDLYEQDHTFEQSDYFRRRKNFILFNYEKRVKTGKLLQNASNLTIVGSPYSMLMYAVGEDPEKHSEFEYENGAIQCYTPRFADGEYLCAFRSPQNSANNIMYFHNIKNKYIDRYFQIEGCIAVNMIKTDSQARSNGADQDSDFYYVTNEPNLVECAKRAYANFPTVVNSIPASSKRYDNTMECQADVDSIISASKLTIGESSNISQVCQSYFCTTGDELYSDYCCILAVVAQCCIDGAKKSYGIDFINEIKYIRGRLNIAEKGYPVFWKNINYSFSKDKINESLHSPMCELDKFKSAEVKPNTRTLPMSEFFVAYPLETHRNVSKRVEKLIADYSLEVLSFNISEERKDDADYLLLREDFDSLVNAIKECCLPSKYLGLINWLLNRCFVIAPADREKKLKSQERKNIDRNRTALLRVLYEVSPESVLKSFAKNVKTPTFLGHPAKM